MLILILYIFTRFFGQDLLANFQFLVNFLPNIKTPEIIIGLNIKITLFILNWLKMIKIKMNLNLSKKNFYYSYYFGNYCYY